MRDRRSGRADLEAEGVIGLNSVATYAIASTQLTLTTDDGWTLVYKAAS